MVTKYLKNMVLNPSRKLFHVGVHCALRFSGLHDTSTYSITVNHFLISIPRFPASVTFTQYRHVFTQYRHVMVTCWSRDCHMVS